MSRRDPPNTRVYVGHLSSRIREDDLDRKFGKYGPIRSIDLKGGFGFVEFDYEEDAEDAVYGLDGCDIEGSRVLVQFARGGRDRGRGGPPPRGGGPPGRSEYRAMFEYLPRDMSWQDLKDLCREVAAAPVFTDIWRERGICKGVAEFRTREDMRRAIKELDYTHHRGERIEVFEDRPPRSYSRSLSRSPPPKKRGRSSRSPSRSRSPKRTRGSRSPSPAAKRRRTRSPSPSPRRSRTRSPSPRRSRSRSKSRSLSRSKSPARSRSVSPRKSRSRTPSPSRKGSRSPSPGRGSSPVAKIGSTSRSASPKSRSPSPK